MKERKKAMIQNLGNNRGQALQNQPKTNNANNKVLTDLPVQQLDGVNLSVVRVNNFDIKPIMFQLL